MKPNDIFNIDEAMMAGGRDAYATEGEVYDLEKEYGAPFPKAKKRSVDVDQEPYPYSQADDEAYFREIWRKNKLAKQKAERDADHDRLATGTNEGVTEGNAPQSVMARNPDQAYQMLSGRPVKGFTVDVLCPDQQTVNNIQRALGSAYTIEQDNSIVGNGIGIEIISPLFGGRNAQQAFQSLIAIIDQNGGQFNNSTQIKIYFQNEGVAENAEYDDEAGMVDNNLATMERAIQGIDEIVHPGSNLPEWCQEKIAQAKGMLINVWDYMKSEQETGHMAEAEGDCEGLPHLTPELAKHISQQIDTEGPHAVEKSIEWGDGAADELLAKIKEMLDDYASMNAEAESMFEAFEEYVAENNLSEDVYDTYSDEMIVEVAAWQKKSGKNRNGGLNRKGVASYRREHPGSKLQTAVTTKPSKLKPGSKAAKRRKSFCARMGGMKGPMKDKHGKPTRKALALRKWNCESVEQLGQMILEAKNGLWANIHAKRERIKHGSHERMRTPGSKGAPTAQAFKDSQKTSKKNESAIPNYADMFESKLNEFASCGGTGGIATSMSVGNPAAGGLFGGSYTQKNSPFAKKTKKRTGKMIKR